MTAVDRLAKMLASMERRLRVLERAPQLGNSSFEGTIREYDDDGQSRVMLGLIPDGSHGLAAYNEGEWKQFPRDAVMYDGVYDPDRTYPALRIVAFDGGVYLSVAPSTGVDPDPDVGTPWLPMGAPGGPVTIPVLHGDPASPGEGEIWFNLDATC